jgi:hypothetical protein
LANSYYTASGAPSQGSTGSSAVMRAEFNALVAGFDKLPTLGGNAGQVVTINAGATGLTTSTAITITGSNVALAGNLAITGSLTGATTGAFSGAVSMAGLTATTANFSGLATFNADINVVNNVYNAVGNMAIGANAPTGTLSLKAGGVVSTTISAAGNVTIAAPSSGVALTTQALANLSAADLTTADVTNGVYSRWVNAASAVVGQIGSAKILLGGAYADFAIVSATGQQTIFGTSTRITMTHSGAGNVTIAAPSSGVALTITAPATNLVALLNDAGGGGVSWRNATNTAGYDIGLLSGAGDASAYIQQRANAPLLIATNNSTRITIAAAGNVTIAAPSSGDALVISGSTLTPSVAAAFNATTMTLDTNLSNVFTTTFTANVTVAPTISNPSDGQTFNWLITQDATGSRTMTWPTSFKWPGGTVGVLSTAANSVDMVTCTYRASTGFFYTTLLKAFA